MKTLEEALREAGERGLTHLSLSATSRGWAAIAAPSTGHHYVNALAKDPVEALLNVLNEMPKAPKRRLSAKGITATVTEQEPPKEEG